MKTLTKEITIDLTLQSADELAALFNLIHNSNMDGQTFFICGEAADVLDNLVARVGKGMARHLIEQDDRYRMTAQDLDDIFQNTDEKDGDEPEIGNGSRVKFNPEYTDNVDPDEVFTVTEWDGRRGWAGDENGVGWSFTAGQVIVISDEE